MGNSVSQSCNLLPISAQSPSPLPATPVSTLRGISEHQFLKSITQTGWGTQKGWFPKSNYIKHFFMSRCKRWPGNLCKKQPITVKGLWALDPDRPALEPRFSTHLIPGKLLHFFERQFTHWQNRDNNIYLGRLFWGSVIMVLKAWCLVHFYY